MRLLLSILLTSLFLIPTVRGNGDFNVQQTAASETTHFAEPITQDNITSYNSSTASFLHINSSQSVRTIYPSRSYPYIPADLQDSPTTSFRILNTGAFATFNPPYYKRIGLRLLFPKHYFW